MHLVFLLLEAFSSVLCLVERNVRGDGGLYERLVVVCDRRLVFILFRSFFLRSLFL